MTVPSLKVVGMRAPAIWVLVDEDEPSVLEAEEEEGVGDAELAGEVMELDSAAQMSTSRFANNTSKLTLPLGDDWTSRRAEEGV